MKYIFYVHSHICYYMSLSVIKYLDLKNDDIIFLYTRHYTPYCTSNYSCAEISDIESAIYPLSISKILHMYQIIRKLDRVIAAITGNEVFSCFVPEMSGLLPQIIVTNKNCVRYDFIEEGTIYYIEDSYSVSPYRCSVIMKAVFDIFNRFCKRIQLGQPNLRPLKKDDSPFYYVLRSPYSISSTKKTISLDLYPDETLIDDNTFSNDKPILIMDSVLESQLAEYNNVLQCYEYIIRELPCKNGLYVKLHPRNGPCTLNLLSEIEALNKIKMHFLTLPIEQILLFNKNKKPVYIGSIHSSLLLYAKIISSKNVVVTGAKYLREIDPVYRKWKGWYAKFDTVLG